MSDERAEIILDRPIIRPQGRIRVHIQQGGLFTDGDRFNYPNWFGNATDDYDELLFILNGKPFLYHRAKRPRLVQENAPGDSPQYFDLDSTIRHLSNSEAVRWFDRQGRDVPSDPAFTAAVKPAAVAAKAPARSLTKKSKALAALVDHPGWTDEQIAEAAGCHVKSLYRWEDFKTARAAMRSGRDAIPTGTKNDDTGDVEAWDDDE